AEGAEHFVGTLLDATPQCRFWRQQISRAADCLELAALFFFCCGVAHWKFRPPTTLGNTRSKPSRGPLCLKLASGQAGAQHATPLQRRLARIGWFLAVDVFVFDVAVGVGVYCGLVDGS